jgi:FkbM family methyltransferase
MFARLLQPLLTRSPRLFVRLLRAAGRGSLEKRLFLQLIRRGDVVCDIGANTGYFTRLFSDIVGPNGSVEAFEPGPDTFATLESAVGSRRNVRLHPLALGEREDATVPLFQPGADHGQASLCTHDHGSWAGAQTVSRHECRLTTLDACARDWTRLDFVKCDVEGAELLVLRGARETLARFSPVLFVEVYAEWTRAFGYLPADLVAFLTDAGYDTFFLVDDAVRRIAAGTRIDGPANLLCAKHGALPDVLEA